MVLARASNAAFPLSNVEAAFHAADVSREVKIVSFQAVYVTRATNRVDTGADSEVASAQFLQRLSQLSGRMSVLLQDAWLWMQLGGNDLLTMRPSQFWMSRRIPIYVMIVRLDNDAGLGWNSS